MLAVVEMMLVVPQPVEPALRRIGQAKADQAALIERMGGPEVASTLGASGATPAPKVENAA